MASSNRHWPSMFKSKPNHQWQHDHINSSLISSSACHRSPYSPGCEERTPEPKPRWNPRPEQIRILESIFNSGIVNPPRDEIRKIRAQLQEYGQVGDANVFYWFQNRKSRSKHKLRQIQSNAAAKSTKPPPPTTKFAPNSSSSSSDKSSSNEKTISAAATVIELLNSPTASVNQNQPFLAENYFLPVQQNPPPPPANLGVCFSDHLSGAADQGLGNCNNNFLLSELMLMSNCPSKIRDDEDEEIEKMKSEQHLSYTATAVSDPAHSFIPHSNFPNNQILQGIGDLGGPTTRSTVFINDVCFEVGLEPFNVREAFGDDAVLIQSTGQPVLTNDWGVTLHPLQHGSFYYLLRPFTPSPDHCRTMDLI
ncbi:hypothetical protein CASFOL_014296 [Castilleja foliolosa]|uniref:Protein WUSCHEL n=1 Tax=Castilleja foliolosa TaxID=1961234 RepID=A0ABD3DRJ5_9LAMI